MPSGDPGSAFTGAEQARPGLFERLQPGGALFLDEIGELPLGFQAKLLRVLQERCVQRLGGQEVRKVPGRMLAATNRDLPAMVAAGDFRNDLYQRVSGVEIKPPTLCVQLQDKPSDLGLMALHIAVKTHGPDEGAALAERAMPTLLRKLRSNYAWPGNFRELERLVHRALVQSTAPSTRRPTDTPVTGLVDAIAAGHTTWDAFERQVVAEVFTRTNSLRKGAEMLGMSRPRFKGLLPENKAEAPRKKPPRGKRTGQRGASRKGAGAAPGGDPAADAGASPGVTGASMGTADASTKRR